MLDEDKIYEFINYKILENEYIDYKQQWHDNNVELLRDILAFVNTTHDNDCYIIFGIEDKTFEITGVGEDNNRKTTQNITDLFMNTSFSTDPPKISVDTIKMENKEIDVLTIFNTSNVPLFITEKISKPNKGSKKNSEIYPGQIITRINDTNTSKNQTASDVVLEKLYRKRMHLDKSIYERYEYLLSRLDDWNFENHFHLKLIYKFDPNFYIVIKETEEDEFDRKVYTGDMHPWLIGCSGYSPDWKINQYNEILFMYGQHQIFTFKYLLFFERFRGIIVYPDSGCLGGKKDILYNYINKESLEWRFMNLYEKTYNNSKRTIKNFYDLYYSTHFVYENIVFYENDEERKIIESYCKDCERIKDLEKILDSKIEPDEEEIENLQIKNPNFTEKSLININIAKAINKRLELLRQEKDLQNNCDNDW